VSRDKEIIIRKRKRGGEQRLPFTPTHFSARARSSISTLGIMPSLRSPADTALQFNKATPADLERWARTRARWLEEMEG
jgi:hypothetical protein